MLLLGEPASLRFEALSPFGTPVLIVAGDPQSLTLWEVLDNRAYLAPASPDANRRWLGLALGGEDLVALLAARARPLPDPTRVELVAPDEIGPSLRLTGRDVEQRIWFDPASGQARAGRVDRQEPGPGHVHADAAGGPAGRAQARDAGRHAARLGHLPRPQDEHRARPRAAEADCPGTR